MRWTITKTAYTQRLNVYTQRLSEFSPKRTKTSTLFQAHRFILRHWSDTIGEFCKREGDKTPIPITDVKPDIFRHMLYYCYGGKVADAHLKDNAKEVIDAAHKYGVVGLKLEAEA